MPGTSAPPRALVVDDAAENRMLVSALLIQQGFQVDQAADGEAAVQAAEQTRPDLIVLDIGLPDIDGVEVCRRVRSFSDAHVLMLTAQDTELDKVVGFEAGADRRPAPSPRARPASRPAAPPRAPVEHHTCAALVQAVVYLFAFFSPFV